MTAYFQFRSTSLSRCALTIALLLAPLLTLAQTKGLPDPRYELKGDAVIRALQGGGYTLIFRHTTRSPKVTESNERIVIADCTTQIPLSDLGKAQALGIGESMRKLKIPIGETIASPFCRTMDTARAIAGSARAEDAVLGHVNADFQNPMDFTRLRKIMITPPQRGTNRIIVGHSSAFDNMAGDPSLEEGECGIFKIVDGRPVLVARALVEDWQVFSSRIK